MKNRSRLTLFALPLTLLVAFPALASDAPPAPSNPAPSPVLTGNLIAKTLFSAQQDGRILSVPQDKDGRVLVSDFTVADARLSSTEGVTFDAPLAAYSQEQLMSDPTLRDQVEVVLTPAVVAQLSDLGIDDPIAHFKGRTLQVRGVRKETMYTGFPAYIVYTVTVDRLEDIKVMGNPSKPAASAAATAR